jgi:hypothetical protein
MPGTDDLTLLFTAPLDRAGMAYLVSGSVACMIYGEPRLTNDVDLVLDLPIADVNRLAAAFPADAYYCPPAEVLIVEAGRARRGHFNLIHHETGHKADVYLRGEDPLHAWAFERRLRVEIGEGASIWIAPPEYVILRKLEYVREGRSEKHTRDVQGMLRASGETLDRVALGDWLARLGLVEFWADVAGGG